MASFISLKVTLMLTEESSLNERFQKTFSLCLVVNYLNYSVKLLDIFYCLLFFLIF